MSTNENLNISVDKKCVDEMITCYLSRLTQAYCPRWIKTKNSVYQSVYASYSVLTVFAGYPFKFCWLSRFEREYAQKGH